MALGPGPPRPARARGSRLTAGPPGPWAQRCSGSRGVTSPTGPGNLKCSMTFLPQQGAVTRHGDAERDGNLSHGHESRFTELIALTLPTEWAHCQASSNCWFRFWPRTVTVGGSPSQSRASPGRPGPGRGRRWPPPPPLRPGRRPNPCYHDRRSRATELETRRLRPAFASDCTVC